jgi:hypothetical protein
VTTGIISIATYLHGIPVLPKVLFWLSALFLAELAAATGARILRYPHAFAADIQSIAAEWASSRPSTYRCRTN